MTALRVDERGAAGDRTHALFDVHRGQPRQLTVRQIPRLLAWSALYPDQPGSEMSPSHPGLPTLVHPDGRRLSWEEPATPDTLAEDLGRLVTLVRDERGQQDYGPTVLVTVEATRRAIEIELGREVDLRRFRTNIHIELDEPAYAEETWIGRTLLVGDVELTIQHPCERCVIPTRDPDDYRNRWPELLSWLHREHQTLFGVIARPVGEGTLRVGDAVALR